MKLILCPDNEIVDLEKVVFFDFTSANKVFYYFLMLPANKNVLFISTDILNKNYEKFKGKEIEKYDFISAITYVIAYIMSELSDKSRTIITYHEYIQFVATRLTELTAEKEKNIHELPNG